MLYFHNDNFIELGGDMECIICDDAYKSSETRQTARRAKNPPKKLADRRSLHSKKEGLFWHVKIKHHNSKTLLHKEHVKSTLRAC